MEINERIRSNVSGRTYTVTWVSDVVTQAEVGFAKTDSEGESFFIKRLLNAKYQIAKEGKKLTAAALERNKKQDARYESFRKLYDSITQGCGESGACVPILDYFRDGPFYYTVYRKINAASLTLDEISKLSSNDKAKLLLRLVQGLQPMHSLGVIHGDLKPENVLVQKDGDSWRIRLIDMNDCYRAGSPNEPGAVVGTPDYYSPELTAYNTYEIEDWEDEAEMSKVRSMANDLTTKSDVFALGIIFHEFYTGKRPRITDDSIKYICEAANAGKLEVDASIPEKLRNLVSGMLAPNYIDRPTLGQVGNAVRSLLVDGPVTPPVFTIVKTGADMYRVILENDNSDVDIYYTTDGSDPKITSSRYSGPLELKKYTPIKAFCVKGKRRSGIVSRQAWVKSQPLSVSRCPIVIVKGRHVTIQLDDKSPEMSKIFYTTDGSKPSSESFCYSAPFEVGDDVSQIKAIVIESGINVRPSEIVERKVYHTGPASPIISKVRFQNQFSITSEEGYDIYYTLDGTEPTADAIKYKEQFKVDDIDRFQIKAICISKTGVKSKVSELKKPADTIKKKF